MKGKGEKWSIVIDPIEGEIMREKVVVSWRGGKDSVMTLYEIIKSDRYEIVSLLTTVFMQNERISHHGVRTELLEQQAAAIDWKGPSRSTPP